MEYLPLIIQLVTGAIGGNLAGSAMKNLSLGTLWNSVAGILGGGLGGQVLGMLGMGAAAAGDGGMDMMSILSSVLAGGIGGGAGLGIVSLIKNMMGGKAS